MPCRKRRGRSRGLVSCRFMYELPFLLTAWTCAYRKRKSNTTLGCLAVLGAESSSIQPSCVAVGLCEVSKRLSD